MDGVNAYEKRNSQAAFLGKFLKGNRLFGGHAMKEGADLSSTDLVGEILVAQVLVSGIYVFVGRALSRRDVAGSHILAHLSDLLLQRHFSQKQLCPVRSW